MNRERAKELLPIIEAFANGENIQFISNQFNPEIEDHPAWNDLPKNELLTMTFPCDDYNYRIKPKLREFWINPEADDSDAIIYEAFNPNDDDFILVREVLS